MLAAVAQMEPQLGEIGCNRETVVARMEEAVSQGDELVVLTEYAVTGYVFESSKEAVSETLLVAEIDIEKARNKSLVPGPGEYEMHLFGHRCPELYGALAEETAQVNQR